MWGLSDRAGLRIVPEAPPSLRDRVIMAGLCLAVASAARLVSAPLLHDTLPFITFFPAILLAAVWGGGVSGLLVLVLTPVLVHFIVAGSPGRDVLSISGVVAFAIAGGLMTWVGAALSHSLRGMARLRRQQAEAEAQLRTVVQELAHRGRNGFAIVTAVVQQSARTATSVDDYRDKIVSRLDAMARSQDLVTKTAGHLVNLSDLLSSVLEPFGAGRLNIADSAKSANISGDIATGLALVFHELATNATKYGALSTPGGRVDIALEEDDRMTHLIWRERGGPPVLPPSRHGFGVRLLATAFRGKGGSTEIGYPPEGVVCRVSYRLRPAQGAAHQASP